MVVGVLLVCYVALVGLGLCFVWVCCIGLFVVLITLLFDVFVDSRLRQFSWVCWFVTCLWVAVWC